MAMQQRIESMRKGKKDGISVPGEKKDEGLWSTTSRINRSPQEIMMGSSFPSSPNMGYEEILINSNMLDM